MRTVFTALRHAISAGKNTVLVTILSHTGSAPRGAGSQMLVGKHGLMAGTVGGGAVEGRAIEEALRLLQDGGGAEIREYPLPPSLKGDIGLVCGGEVTVLLSLLRLHGVMPSRMWTLVSAPKQAARCGSLPRITVPPSSPIRAQNVPLKAISPSICPLPSVW